MAPRRRRRSPSARPNRGAEIAAGTATATTPVTSSAGAAAGVAVVTTPVRAVAERIVSAVRAALRRIARRRRARLEERLGAAGVPANRITAALEREDELEAEFQERAEERLRLAAELALRAPDPSARARAVQAALEREQRYARQRSWAQFQRVFHAIEAEALEAESPLGAYWELGPAREHTPDCVWGSGIYGGPEPSRGYRRPYTGQLVEIVVASGDVLPVTPNHPVLTTAGWRPSGLLRVGDQLLSHRAGRKNPELRDEQHVGEVRTIEEVVDALAEAPGVLTGTAPADHFNFHGDRAEQEVDVVTSYGGLDLRALTATTEKGDEAALVGANPVAAAAAGGRCPTCGGSRERGVGPRAAAQRIGHLSMSGGYAGALGGIPGREREADALAALAADFYAAREQEALEAGARDASLLGKTLRGLPGAVALDEVIEIRRKWVSGHVYNVSTDGGWYTVGGVIVRNCLAMSGKFWPWPVLRLLPLPLHVGCKCRLRSYGDAVTAGLIGPGDVPGDEDAMRRALPVIEFHRNLQERRDDGGLGELRLREQLAEVPGADVSYLAAAPLAEERVPDPGDIHWREWLHPRDAFGRFIKKIGNLPTTGGPRRTTFLDSRTRVTRDTDGRFRVVRNTRMIRGIRTPEDAAKIAFDVSAKAPDPDSVGGERRFRGRDGISPFDEFLAADTDVDPDEAVDPQGNPWTRDSLRDEIARLGREVDEADRETAAGDRYAYRRADALNARRENLRRKLARLEDAGPDDSDADDAGDRAPDPEAEARRQREIQAAEDRYSRATSDHWVALKRAEENPGDERLANIAAEARNAVEHARRERTRARMEIGQPGRDPDEIHRIQIVSGDGATRTLRARIQDVDQPNENGPLRYYVRPVNPSGQDGPPEQAFWVDGPGDSAQFERFRRELRFLEPFRLPGGDYDPDGPAAKPPETGRRPIGGVIGFIPAPVEETRDGNLPQGALEAAQFYRARDYGNNPWYAVRKNDGTWLMGDLNTGEAAPVAGLDEAHARLYARNAEILEALEQTDEPVAWYGQTPIAPGDRIRDRYWGTGPKRVIAVDHGGGVIYDEDGRRRTLSQGTSMIMYEKGPARTAPVREVYAPEDRDVPDDPEARAVAEVIAREHERAAERVDPLVEVAEGDTAAARRIVAAEMTQDPDAVVRVGSAWRERLAATGNEPEWAEAWERERARLEEALGVAAAGGNWDEKREALAALRKHQRLRTRERARWVAEQLRRVRRDIGTGKPRGRKGGSKLNGIFEEGLEYLPGEWVSRMDRPGLRKSNGRAHYMGGRANRISSREGDRTTMLHEMGHWLEDQDPLIGLAQAAFYRKRTEGEELQPLQRLKPGYGYRRDERARPDKWANPYVGKWYGDDTFEILSMGLEYLFFPETHREAIDDPEHVAWVAGLILSL